MTAQDENQEDVEKEDCLDSLIRKVESINKNVEDILDRLNEHFDHSRYESMWNGREDFNDKYYWIPPRETLISLIYVELYGSQYTCSSAAIGENLG